MKKARIVLVSLLLAILLVVYAFLPTSIHVEASRGFLSVDVGYTVAQSGGGGGTKQVIPGGYYDLLHATTVEYNTLVGYTWSATEAYRQHVASPAGTLSRLVIELNDSPGAGKSYTFVVMKNGVATDVSVTIADAATTGNSGANSVSIAGGDLIGIRCTPSGTPTARYARWSVHFEGTTTKQSWIPGGAIASTITTRYAPVWYGASTSSTTENDTRQVIPTAGKIRNLYVSGHLSPGGGTQTYRFTLRLNGVSTALTADMVGDATTANDTTNEVTVAAGDVVTLMIEYVNSPSNTVACAVGFTFVADTDGESIVMGSSSDDLSASATEYNYPSSSYYAQDWTATEAQRYHGGQPTTFKKLYVLLSGTPGEGKSYTIGVRVNGSTKLSVTIADTATTGNDTVNSFTLTADHDVLNMIATPAGTPTARDAYWGFVQYIAPEVGEEPDISVLPITYDFESVAASSTPSTATNYFTITNASAMITNHTISVTTSSWSGGTGWTHSDTATAGADTAGLLANRGGSWGTGDVIVKYAVTHNYIYQNCPVTTNYSFGLKLITPTSFGDGAQKSITVRITAVASPP